MATKYTRFTIKATLDDTGAATAYSNRPVLGRIVSCFVERPDNAVEVTLSSEDVVSQTILDLASGTSNESIYPRVKVQDNTNTDITYDGTNEIYEKYQVFSRLKLSCANGTSGDVVKVTTIVEEY